MKRLFLTATAAAVLIFAAPALAEPHHGGAGAGGSHAGGGGSHAGGGGGHTGGGHSGGTHLGGGGGGHTGGGSGGTHTHAVHTHSGHTGGGSGGTHTHAVHTHSGHTGGGIGHGHNTTNVHMNVNTNVHAGGGAGGGHGHIDFNRHNVSASHHFHYRGGEYRWPGGYHYQRWSYGQTFPSIFWAQDYWIDDYADYGLAYPPDGAVWVRYGNDAVLVDRDSGEILEVVYDQFY
jgi:Ni/Co efflux regulator RcnB